MSDADAAAAAAAKPAAAEENAAAAAATDETEADAMEKLTPEEIKAQIDARVKALEKDGKGASGQHVLLTGDAMNARTTEDAAKAEKPTPIKLATSDATTDVEGEMTADDKRKMQAMLGVAKSKDTKVFANLSGKELTVAAGELDPRATIVIANCKDCTVVIDSLCTKVFVQACDNVTLECKGKIVTHTVEVYKCTDFTATFHVKVGTLQADMSKNLNLTYTKEQHFGNIIWAGCWNMEVKMSDTGSAIATGFGAMKEQFKDINEERSQFKVSMVNKKILNEKIIRMDNGFPTTRRELDVFEKRQEHNLKQLAKEYGVVVPNKKKEEPKVGRNEPCTCGSGRKFKKCCGMGVA